MTEETKDKLRLFINRLDFIDRIILSAILIDLRSSPNIEFDIEDASTLIDHLIRCDLEIFPVQRVFNETKNEEVNAK